ncbi:DUF1989 domain-containing protein [Pseudonocardia spinosispora]|uniref:DUF1989 domain-containing protein n=1 Tax=Pseudonocardia spinosispora TaxID=103441 RepID=UPI000426A82D|nr:urea carboxylase-associated family protein [Pseudonocardia spinosispora]
MTVLAARTGRALRLSEGDVVRIVNTHGTQVVDTWAFADDNAQRVLSMAHTRVRLGRLFVRTGDQLVDNHREPMLELAEDTSPGVHDALIPACDITRYRQLGHVGYHDNCHDNFRAAVTATNADGPELVPDPLNLFMNVPVDATGQIEFRPPTSRPGDSVTLRALTNLVLVLSACPQDLAPVNGQLQQPTAVEIEAVAPTSHHGE